MPGGGNVALGSGGASCVRGVVRGLGTPGFSFSRGKRTTRLFGFGRISARPEICTGSLPFRPVPGTVLVVDDDAAIRFLCRVNLELDGWRVRDAGTLEDARRHLADGRVDVVLLDVHVGGGSGVDFLDEVRRDHPGTPVAMLTGSVGSSTLDGVTADGIVAKPFTLEELVGTVHKLAR